MEAKLDLILGLVHTLTERLNAMELNCSVESIDKKIEEAVERKVTEYLEEKDEKESRKLNIVITNVPESKMETPTERKKDDLENIRKLVEKIVPETEEVGKVLENPVRLGQYKVGTNVKPRLLRITVKCEETKANILKRAYKLNKDVTDKTKKIYINQDLTSKERETEKKLRDELRVRRGNGEDDLVIRNGKIVKRMVRQTPDNSGQEAASTRH